MTHYPSKNIGPSNILHENYFSVKNGKVRTFFLRKELLKLPPISKSSCIVSIVKVFFTLS